MPPPSADITFPPGVSLTSRIATLLSSGVSRFVGVPTTNILFTSGKPVTMAPPPPPHRPPPPPPAATGRRRMHSLLAAEPAEGGGEQTPSRSRRVALQASGPPPPPFSSSSSAVVPITIVDIAPDDDQVRRTATALLQAFQNTTGSVLADLSAAGVRTVSLTPVLAQCDVSVTVPLATPELLPTVSALVESALGGAQMSAALAFRNVSVAGLALNGGAGISVSLSEEQLLPDGEAVVRRTTCAATETDNGGGGVVETPETLLLRLCCSLLAVSAMCANAGVRPAGRRVSFGHRVLRADAATGSGGCRVRLRSAS